MADTQTQAAPTATLRPGPAEDPPLPRPPAREDQPPPPPKESFSRFHQQRQASELRRLYRHIHPELRRNLAEAVAEDLAEVLGSEEPTEGDVQCMRWIFENWRLDAIGDHDRPPAKEPVPGGDVQATSRKFEEGSVANCLEPEAAGPRPAGGDVRAARQLFETKALDELTGQAGEPEATAREPAAGGDVQGTRTLFETKALDRRGSPPSVQEQSPLELRSEIQELKGDVKKTVRLFQTEPLCAIRDAEGAIHEVKAACREEVRTNAVRSARWLFETQPLDAINRDPSQVRVIRGISLEEGARPDVSAARWVFETQPLDAIRETLVDEKDFQPSPHLVPAGPNVQQQRRLFETRALDTLKGDDDEPGPEVPPREEAAPCDRPCTLWLFETKPLDAPGDKVQVGQLQQVGPQESEGLAGERVPGDGPSALSLPQSAPQKEGVRGGVKTFKNLFETLPLDSIGQGEPSSPGSLSTAEGTDSAGQSQDTGSQVYALQDGRGHLHALTSVSREQVVGGDVQGCRWMFETQPLDQLGGSPGTVDVVRGVTRQEVVAGDVATARWLFETQPLEVIHQREQQERQEDEGMSQVGPQPENPPKGDVKTVRWLFETRPMSELGEKQGSQTTDPAKAAEARSCTWMFLPQPLDRSAGSGEQRLHVNQIQAGESQTDSRVFETEPLQPAGRPCERRPVRYCSRVEIPSGQVSRHKEVFQALEAGKREDQASRAEPEPVPAGSVRKFTWLFENCPAGSLAAESIRGGGLQEAQPSGPSGKSVPEGPESAATRTLRTLHATPGVLHRGGILMEARGPGELCLAKFVLPGPGHGGPQVQKEELVSGELPRIVRQVLRRPDVDRRGLLVQEGPEGQLHLKPLRLPAPGGSGDVEDLDLEFQQLLACSLGTSVARTGLVMQETEPGLVALTAYCLQPWATSRGPERSSVQLLASCIDKGDLSSLHRLRWEPPAESSPVPADEGAQGLPTTESIIHVPPLDPSMGMGHLRGPRPSASPPQPADSHTGRKAMAALGKPEGALTSPPGPGAPDLQAAMQSLRAAAAEAQSLHQQVLSRHKQGPRPGDTATHFQNGLLQAPVTATGAVPSDTRPMAGRDPKVPAAPRKVSGERNALPGGLPGGRGAVQDGIYAVLPVRTFDAPGGVQPSERGLLPRGAQAASPLQEGAGLSPGPGRGEPGDCTEKAWRPPETAMARVNPGGLPAAETPLKAAPLVHHTRNSGAQAAAASWHSHNTCVPPPPSLSAAVTGPDLPDPAGHGEDPTQLASKPLRKPVPLSPGSPVGQGTAAESQTKPSKPEASPAPRKKPELPPKPAHLSQIPPPGRLLGSLALAPSVSKEAGRREYGQRGTDAARPQAAEGLTTVGQDCVALTGCPRGQGQPQPQPGPSAVAPRSAGSQTVSSCALSPTPPTSSVLSSYPTSPQWGPSPEEKPLGASQQDSPEKLELLQGRQQELQGLLSQAPALEQGEAHRVDVGALQRLFEAVPPQEGVHQAPAAPRQPEVSVGQAFGELTRVSTEVAQLKEQTLARLLAIEEAVHKALSSMSSLQPEADTRARSQGHPQDSGCRVHITDSSGARPHCAGHVAGQPAASSQTEVPCRPEVQSEAKVRGHTEASGQAASTVASTRRPGMLGEDLGLPRTLPSSRDSCSPPTFISVESAMRKLPEAPSPRGSPQVLVKSQDVDQALLRQKGAHKKVGKQEPIQCSGRHTSPQPRPGLHGGLAEAGTPVPCCHSRRGAQ